VNCDSVQRELLEGAAVASMELSAHVEACPACRSFANSLQSVDAAFHALRFTTAPAHLTTMILRRARLERRLERRVLTLALDTITAASTAAAAAAVLFWIYPHPAIIAMGLLLGCLWTVILRHSLSEA